MPCFIFVKMSSVCTGDLFLELGNEKFLSGELNLCNIRTNSSYEETNVPLQDEVDVPFYGFSMGREVPFYGFSMGREVPFAVDTCLCLRHSCGLSVCTSFNPAGIDYY
jgi:hypothetical protein